MVASSRRQATRPGALRARARQRAAARSRGDAAPPWPSCSPCVLLLAWRVAACGGGKAAAATYTAVPPAPAPSLAGDGVKVGTFLGDYSRRFYGLGPVPKRLDVIWKVRLGSGWTSGKFAGDPPGQWAGSGWTGMPERRRGRRQDLRPRQRLRPPAAQDRRRDRHGRLELQVRRHHQEQPVGLPQPEPDQRRRPLHRLRGLAARLPALALEPGRGAVPRGHVRQRQGALAAAGAADRLLQPRRGRQRLLPGRTPVHRRGERLVLRPRSPEDAAVAGAQSASGRGPAAPARRRARRDAPRQHLSRVLAGGAWRQDLRHLGRRPRVRSAPPRPRRHLGLLHRLRHRRVRRADRPRQAAGAGGEAVHQGQRRRALSRSVAAAGQSRGVVLPDRGPPRRRVEGRPHRFGGGQRRLQRRRQAPGAGRVQRDRRLPARDLPGHHGAGHGARA